MADGREESRLGPWRAAGGCSDSMYLRHIWVVGTNHRAGSLITTICSAQSSTILMLRSVARPWPSRPASTSDSAASWLIIDSESAVEVRESRARGICLVPHLRLNNMTDFQQLRRVALRRSAAALVNWVRDPRRWHGRLHVPIRGPAGSWLPRSLRRRDFIGNAQRSGEIGPHLTCQGLRSLANPSTSSATSACSPTAAGKDHAAFLTELWRSNMNGIKQMQSTTQALSNVSSDIAITVDLDQAVASCDTEQRVFSVLGGQPPDACVKFGCRDDPMHSSAIPEGLGVRQEHVSALHEPEQGEADGSILGGLRMNNYWFAKHVEQSESQGTSSALHITFCRKRRF